MKIGITSVLIMKENILFLEEWIDYHINLGFDNIFLYDNSKVQKRNNFNSNNEKLIPQKTNKYGIKYDEIVPLTKEQIDEIIEKLKQKYKNKVYFTEWSPKDKDGFVLHNQREAHVDCLNKLKKSNIVDWCASIDIDEFIVIDNGNTSNIKSILNKLDPNITSIKISQIRFETRFNNLNKLITTINKAELMDLDRNHSCKYLYKVNHTFDVNIHSCQSKGIKIHPPNNLLCFNHYKIDFSLKENKYKIIESNINTNIINKLKENCKNYIINNYIENYY
jgi:hypothetical protein